MRSVVVVLPASICAMIPMLRVLASSAFLAIFPSCLFSGLVRSGGPAKSSSAARTSWGALPAVMCECLVRFGHLVCVLTAFDARAQAVAGVQQLVHQTLGHRLLAALAGVTHQPAERQRRASTGLDLDRHLIGGTADPATLHFDR